MNVNPRRADRKIVLLLTLFPAIFFWQATSGRRTLGEADAVFWFFPIWQTTAEQIRAGHLPLWNPHMYSGMPLFAQWQPGLLDPLNWIHLLGASSATMTIAGEAAFSLALVGTFIFARRAGLGRQASITAAVIYALSGYLTARTIYPGLLHISALLPLALWCTERLFQEGRRRDVVGGALVIAWQACAASPQPFLYALILLTSYALYRAADKKSGRVRFLLQFASMPALGLALAAVQIAPALEIARLSVRQQVPYEFFTWHSLHPLSLLTAIIPFLHGQGRGIYQMPYWGAYWHHNEAQIYLGVPALALALSAAVYGWRNKLRPACFWSVIALCGLALALGKYLAPLAWLTYQIPLLNRFRSPNRHWMEVSLAIAMLAGYAVDRLLNKPNRTITWIVQSSAVLLLMICGAAGIYVLNNKEHAASFIRKLPDMEFLPANFLQQAGAEFYLPIISALCLTAALIFFTHTPQQTRSFPLLLAAIALDFQLYASCAPISNPAKLETLIGQSMPGELAAKQSQQEPLRYHLMLNPAEGSFDYFWLHGHEMATGYDPLLNTRYQTFSGINEAGRSTLPTLLDSNDRTLDLLNVRYVLIMDSMLTPRAGASAQTQLGGVSFTGDARAELHNGEQITLAAPPGASDTLAVVSTLANSTAIATGATVAEITVNCGSATVASTTLQAGRDTAEWAYDRGDVQAQIKHARAPIAYSTPGEGFQAHSYLAKLRLPATALKCTAPRLIQVKARTSGPATLNLENLALHDSTSGQSTPVTKAGSASLLDNSRWREIALTQPQDGYPNLRAYENLHALPRAWLVNHVAVKSEDEQLQLIRSAAFDPAKTALSESAAHLDQSLLSAQSAGAPGQVVITRREPTRLLLNTEATQATMLVLSEMHYPGWRAKVDGRDTELFRVNYLLHGVALPPGKHQVEVFYWPRLLTVGAIISLSTALMLFCLALFDRRKRRLASRAGPAKITNPAAATSRTAK